MTLGTTERKGERQQGGWAPIGHSNQKRWARLMNPAGPEAVEEWRVPCVCYGRRRKMSVKRIQKRPGRLTICQSPSFWVFVFFFVLFSFFPFFALFFYCVDIQSYLIFPPLSLMGFFLLLLPLLFRSPFLPPLARPASTTGGGGTWIFCETHIFKQ